MISVVTGEWSKLNPWGQQIGLGNNIPQLIDREEFEKLRKEVLALKDLVEAAGKFDKATGQPDCEQEDKVALFRKLAKVFGIDIEGVLKPAAS
jgi:hypothetical protein